MIYALCMRMFVSVIQADFLEPHLHGVVAFFNFMLVRSDFFENNAKGRLVGTFELWQGQIHGGYWGCGPPLAFKCGCVYRLLTTQSGVAQLPPPPLASTIANSPQEPIV